MYGRAKEVADTCHSGQGLYAGTRRVAALMIVEIGPDIIGVRRRLVLTSK